MIIFQHALQNLFQVADLKQIGDMLVILLPSGVHVISCCFTNYLEAPVGPALLLDPAEPRLIKPRAVSVNESTRERERESSGEDKDGTSLDITDSQEATGH